MCMKIRHTNEFVEAWKEKMVFAFERAWLRKIQLTDCFSTSAKCATGPFCNSGREALLIVDCHNQFKRNLGVLFWGAVALYILALYMLSGLASHTLTWTTGIVLPIVILLGTLSTLTFIQTWRRAEEISPDPLTQFLARKWTEEKLKLPGKNFLHELFDLFSSKYPDKLRFLPQELRKGNYEAILDTRTVCVILCLNAMEYMDRIQSSTTMCMSQNSDICYHKSVIHDGCHILYILGYRDSEMECLNAIQKIREDYLSGTGNHG